MPWARIRVQNRRYITSKYPIHFLSPLSHDFLINHFKSCQIVDQKDPIWWQAKIVGDNGRIGLIPSPDLEERRKAYVSPEADYVHKIGICGTKVSIENFVSCLQNTALYLIIVFLDRTTQTQEDVPIEIERWIRQSRFTVVRGGHANATGQEAYFGFGRILRGGKTYPKRTTHQ